MAQKELSRSAREILIQYLEELVDYDLKKFQCFLLEWPVKEGFMRIPKGRLEKANPVRTAEEMISYYQGMYALEITGALLGKINRKDLAEKFRKDAETYSVDNDKLLKTNIQENKKKYMDFIVKKFGVMEENASPMGEYIHLKERYTRLLITKHNCDREEREHEIMSTGRKHREIFTRRAESSYSCIADLFVPDGLGHLPRIVVLQGAAGIGKTMTARKIMLDWASGELFQDKFNYVFYISCREVNQFCVEPTIADLILHSYPEMSFCNIENELEKVLFIVDGFDELKLPAALQLDVPSKTSIMENTILNLIRKSYLPSYILITTRPAALHNLAQWVAAPRLAEILGFSYKDRAEYFIKFFGDEEQGTLALNAVAENDILSTMCFIPIVCWIVCTVLKEGLKKTEHSVFVLKSTTLLYLSFLANLLKQHGSVEAKANINRHLKNLCALANEGVFEQKILFEESDLVSHGLDIEDIQSLFLKNDIFIKDAQCEKHYSFIHLSFQEFFAALYYILEGNGEEDPQKNVMRLLEDYRIQGQNHLMLTVRFLFGLLNAEIMRKMQKSYKWKISADIKLTLKEWVTKEIGNSIEEEQMDLLYCLFEIQDEEFTEEAVQSLDKVRLVLHDRNGINPMDGKVVTYCMKDAPAVQSFSLNRCALTPVELRMLWPCLRKCSSLGLSSCSLTASCCADLSCLLGTNTSLKELDLRINQLEDSGVRHLCEGLKQPSCKLETLTLSNCSLTASCCADISCLLRTNTSLKELNLSRNKLEDSGVRQLCEGLKQPSCKLETLKLLGCSLTASCCADLSCLLRTNTSLKELNLSWNKLEDSGVRQLCKGLKQLSCNLERLNLLENVLTDGCAEALCAVFRQNTTLQYLDLEMNNFTDGCAEALCSALKENTTLRTLKLRHNNFTPQAEAAFREVLGTRPSLDRYSKDLRTGDPTSEQHPTRGGQKRMESRGERRRKTHFEGQMEEDYRAARKRCVLF